MAVGSIQPLTEMSTRVSSWEGGREGKGGRCVGVTILSYFCPYCLEILGATTAWRPEGLSRPVK